MEQSFPSDAEVLAMCDYMIADLEKELLYRRYREHARKYAIETATMAFPTTNHPSYQAMREMGIAIVPFLLEDIASQENGRPVWDFCFWGTVQLIAQLTGATPWKEKDRGRYETIRQAWIRWGQDNGYLPKPEKVSLWRKLWIKLFA